MDGWESFLLVFCLGFTLIDAAEGKEVLYAKGIELLFEFEHALVTAVGDTDGVPMLGGQF